MPMDTDRVYFFSPSDLLVGRYLELSETKLKCFNLREIPSDINDLMELYQIKQYFDKGLRLNRWNNDEFLSLKSKADKLPGIIVKGLNAIGKSGMLNAYHELDHSMEQAFWDVISNYHLWKLIDKEFVKILLDEQPDRLRIICKVKDAVDKYKEVITEAIKNYDYGAGLLLDAYVRQDITPGSRKTFIPSSLTLEEKQEILISYVESEDANVNVVGEICRIKDSKMLQLSDVNRLKALKRVKELNKKLMNDARTVHVNLKTTIQFVDDEDADPAKQTFDEVNGLCYTYSRKYVEKCNNLELFLNFGRLFHYTNRHYLLNLRHKYIEDDTFEQILSNHSKDVYPATRMVMLKRNIAVSQLFLYNNVLCNRHITVEQLLEWGYNTLLRDEFGYEGIRVSLPKEEYPWMEKCRLLFPEFDSIAKQYDMFVNHGDIDPELIRISKPLGNVTLTSSLLQRKYCYIKEGENEIVGVLRLLFAPASTLVLSMHDNDHQYMTFVDILRTKNLKKGDFKDYQLSSLDYLINNKVIEVKDGWLKFANEKQIEILQELWEFQEVSYWHYDVEQRKMIDEMIEQGWLKEDNHLLSPQERHYFNFILNNSEYTNGPALRNIYEHGSNLPEEKEDVHKNAYYTILMLLVVFMLKTVDELYLASELLAESSSQYSNSINP